MFWRYVFSRESKGTGINKFGRMKQFNLNKLKGAMRERLSAVYLFVNHKMLGTAKGEGGGLLIYLYYSKHIFFLLTTSTKKKSKLAISLRRVWDFYLF